METSAGNGRVRRGFIGFYGGVLIAVGLLDILWAILAFKMFNIYDTSRYAPFIRWFPVAAFLSGLSLVTFPMNLIVGYGLLLRRPWARNGVVAAMLTLPVAIVCEVLWWEQFRLNTITAAILVCSALLVHVFFTRAPVRREFGNDAGGILNISIPILIVFLAFSPIVISKGVHIFYKNVPPPVAISKLRISKGVNQGGLQPVRLLDVSLMVPEQVRITTISQFEGHKGNLGVGLRSKDIWMLVENASLSDQLVEKLPVINADGFAFERFLNTNEWNPLAMIARSIGRPSTEKFEMSEIEVSGKKGLLTLLASSKKYFFNFSLYDPEKRRSFGGLIRFDDVEQGKRLMPEIISSIAFSPPEPPDKAAAYFNRGETLARDGKYSEAQYAFLNAFYLAPDNAAYKERIKSLAGRQLSDLKGLGKY